MDHILLTVTQALQLVGLAPCLFVIAFLLATMKRGGENLVPVFYFSALACSFVLPLLGIFGERFITLELTGVLLLGESLIVALSYLLIVQFLHGKRPGMAHWLILTLPIIGGSPFILAQLSAPEVCLGMIHCYATEDLRLLYGVFCTAVVFLLVLYRLSSSASRIAVDDADRRHKYWLIVSIISLNLLLGFIDLLRISGMLHPPGAMLGATLVRMAFIYLVLTSIFRVFYDLFAFAAPSAKAPKTPDASSKSKLQEQDLLIVENIRVLLENNHIYREMGLTRKSLAQRVGLSEHQASRIINAYFRKNFNELINGYRIAEAKKRLITENTPITVIAFEVGFNSIASFNRVFKEIVGAAPSEFRTFKQHSVRQQS